MKKIIIYLIAVFAILFVFKLFHGYSEKQQTPLRQAHFLSNISSKFRNYASKKYQVSAGQSSVRVDQKYEKIANIKSKSTTFEEDEKSVRKEITEFNALIQYEQKSGNKGFRKLNLFIGVPPNNFDPFYVELTKIGKVLAKQITKKDKTNEYKQLNAKKQSLEKLLASLSKLKSKSGKIAEYMKLENRILEIEEQLQRLSVSLGDFDDSNEFCTVQFSLLEGKELKISFLARVKDALEWAVKIYLKIVLALVLVTLLAYLLLLLVDKLKILKPTSPKL